MQNPAIIPLLEERISFVLQALLETKHLYQKLTLDVSSIASEQFANFKGKDLSVILTLLSSQMKNYWQLSDPQAAVNTGTVLITSSPTDSYKSVMMHVPDVKLFCDICDGVEAFNHIGSSTCSYEDYHQRRTLSTESGVLQVFAISYLCQSCKDMQIDFLVRREENRFSIVGRSPIEHVDVPSYIPKQVRKYFSGAIVAHQSGQTLAGLFLFRTLIEQWCRIFSTSKDPLADKALEDYMGTLPKGFKDQFPSLVKLYEVLSSDIHLATGSPELFDSVRNDLTKHFDARRLYELKDSPERKDQ